MGMCEVHEEQTELAGEIGELIARRRAEWRSSHGAGADYMNISMGAITEALATEMIQHCRASFRYTPSLEQMARICAEYPPVLIEAVGRVIGAPAHEVIRYTQPLVAALIEVLAERVGKRPSA
jgi:hypothetical protein